MTKFASKALKILGVAVMVLSSLYIGGSFIYFGAVFIMGGTALLLGFSIPKLDKLEDKMGKYILMPNDLKDPLIKCEKCGKRYEAEEGECPYCKLESLKKRFDWV